MNNAASTAPDAAEAGNTDTFDVRASQLTDEAVVADASQRAGVARAAPAA